MKNKIEDLRNHLFDALESLKDGTMPIEKARAMSEIGKVIVDSAKTEVDFLRITKQNKSGFFKEEATKNFLEPKEKIERPPAVYSNEKKKEIEAPKSEK